MVTRHNSSTGKNKKTYSCSTYKKLEGFCSAKINRLPYSLPFMLENYIVNNPFLAIVPILCPLKTPKDFLFSSV